MIRRLILSLMIVFGCLAVSTAGAAAYNPLDYACQTNGNKSSVCNASTQDPVSGPNGILHKIIRVISIAAGIAAVIMIIVAAIEFVTAGGDAQKVASARKAVLAAAVGLIIVAMSQAILAFVLNKVT